MIRCACCANWAAWANWRSRRSAIACLRWIVALLASTDRAGDITVSASADDCQSSALTGEWFSNGTTEVSAYHGVDAAQGRVIGDGRDPELVLRVTTAPAADLSALHRRIEDEAFTRARRAVGHPELPIQLELA